MNPGAGQIGPLAQQARFNCCSIQLSAPLNLPCRNETFARHFPCPSSPGAWAKVRRCGGHPVHCSPRHFGPAHGTTVCICLWHGPATNQMRVWVAGEAPGYGAQMPLLQLPTLPEAAVCAQPMGNVMRTISGPDPVFQAICNDTCLRNGGRGSAGVAPVMPCRGLQELHAYRHRTIP